MGVLMNKLRFISSFTINTIYEKIANEGLRPSLEQFGLPYYIFAKQDLKDWSANSRQRPLYIKEAMEMFPGENLVWIDADAKILKFPELLFHIPDAVHVGVNYFWWCDHYYQHTNSKTIEILDGTSYYKNDDVMKKFVEEWIERVIPNKINHRLELDKMIKEKKDEINLFLLPREYCYIMTQPNGDQPVIPIQEPIIAHFQASRNARKNLYN